MFKNVIFHFYLGICIGIGIIIFGAKVKNNFGYSFVLCTIGALLSLVTAYLTQTLEHQRFQEQDPVVSGSVAHAQHLDQMRFASPLYPAQPVSYNQQLSSQEMSQNEQHRPTLTYGEETATSYQNSADQKMPENAQPQLYIDQNKDNFTFEQETPQRY